MQFYNKNIMVLVSLLSFHSNSLASIFNYEGNGTRVYGSAINQKENQINKCFINFSSSAVAKRKLSLSKEFRDFLNTDKNMQKIKKINKEGNTETTLDITMLEENILERLAHREQEVLVDYEGCSLKQKGCMLLAGAGVIGALVLANAAGQQSSQDSKKEMSRAAIVLAGASMVTSIFFSYMIGSEADFKNHLEQIKIMKKDWEEFFASAP